MKCDNTVGFLKYSHIFYFIAYTSKGTYSVHLVQVIAHSIQSCLPDSHTYIGEQGHRIIVEPLALSHAST